LQACTELVETRAGVLSQADPVQEALPDGHSGGIVSEHLFWFIEPGSRAAGWAVAFWPACFGFVSVQPYPPSSFSASILFICGSFRFPLPRALAAGSIPKGEAEERGGGQRQSELPINDNLEVAKKRLHFPGEGKPMTVTDAQVRPILKECREGKTREDGEVVQ